MRNTKSRKSSLLSNAARFFTITAVALITPALIDLARLNGSVLSTAGERAAIISAALNMPDGGLRLLRERFHSQLYDEIPDVPDAAQDSHDLPHPQIDNHNPAIPQSSQESAQGSGADANAIRLPRIPDKYRAELISENFAGHDGGTLISIPYGAGYIKNDTERSEETIAEILDADFELTFSGDDEPQVLLFHTHATESFERYDSNVYDTRNTWRSTDNNNNMAAVGSAMQQVLEENGISVIHDTTQHDYPSYNGSYERSAATVKKYLDEFPSIKIVLDLHRDAMERENQAIVKPVATIDGKKAAQIMIIAGCDDGTMNMPNWRKNLRFAAEFQNAMESRYPDLTRPIYFCYRKYNMNLSNGSLLLEFGSNANTLDEAIYSAELAGRALADLIKENTKFEQED